jgi:hypothetical protein
VVLVQFCSAKYYYWLIVLKAASHVMFSIIEGGCPHFLRTSLTRSGDIPHKIWQAQQEQCTMQQKEWLSNLNKFQHSSAVKCSVDFSSLCL